MPKVFDQGSIVQKTCNTLRLDRLSKIDATVASFILKGLDARGEMRKKMASEHPRKYYKKEGVARFKDY